MRRACHDGTEYLDLGPSNAIASNLATDFSIPTCLTTPTYVERTLQYWAIRGFLLNHRVETLLCVARRTVFMDTVPVLCSVSCFSLHGGVLNTEHEPAALLLTRSRKCTVYVVVWCGVVVVNKQRRT